jgi:hypothetical protein
MSNTTKRFKPTVSYTNKNGATTSVEAPKYRLVKRKIKSYISESSDGVVNVTRYRRGHDGVFTESWKLNADNPKRRAVVTGGHFVSQPQTQPQANAQTTQTPTAQTSAPTSAIVIPQTVSATTNTPAASLFNTNTSIPQNI